MGFLDDLLADPELDLPDAVVVDVGRTEERGWTVVEANACWASGLCGSDLRDLLPVLQSASALEKRASMAERAWSRASHLRGRSAQQAAGAVGR